MPIPRYMPDYDPTLREPVEVRESVEELLEGIDEFPCVGCGRPVREDCGCPDELIEAILDGAYWLTDMSAE